MVQSKEINQAGSSDHPGAGDYCGEFGPWDLDWILVRDRVPHAGDDLRTIDWLDKIVSSARFECACQGIHVVAGCQYNDRQLRAAFVLSDAPQTSTPSICGIEKSSTTMSIVQRPTGVRKISKMLRACGPQSAMSKSSSPAESKTLRLGCGNPRNRRQPICAFLP